MNLIRVAQLTALGVLANRLRHGANMPKVVAPEMSPREHISVIVPARNEASNIGRCLESLEDVHEVIVVDDGSADETAAIARSHGVRVIKGEDLPDAWIGKPWALQQGLQHASGEIVVCLDADTISSEGLIRALVDQLRDVDVVSFAARFRCKSIAETSLSASMLSTLVYRFGPPGTPLQPHRVIANGQCMAFRRRWLLDRKGFELSSAHMTDDVALVRGLAKSGARVRFADGSNYLDVDMHSSTRELWREWGRSLPMHDTTNVVTRWADLAFLWIALALPLPRLLLRQGNIVDVAFLGIRCALSFAFRRVYANQPVTVLLSPLTDVAAVIRLTQATVRPVRTWRGRRYS